MIEYIIAHNPDDRILLKAKEHIESNKLICFPTDSSWVIATSAFNSKAAEQLYKIKNENQTKHFSLLCKDLSQVSTLAIVKDYAFKVMKRNTPGRFTFILEANKEISKVIKASKTDKEIGVRIPKVEFLPQLIETIGSPLISTNITPELLGISQDDFIYSTLIEDALPGFDLFILDPGEFEFEGSSTVVKMDLDEIEIIRQADAQLK